jgi:hypothetical protein
MRDLILEAGARPQIQWGSRHSGQGSANELDIDESYLNHLAEEVRKDLGQHYLESIQAPERRDLA